MKIWFADTSAVVKRYVREPGSDWLRNDVVKHDIIISQITPIEIMAALGRRFRQGVISRFAFYQARRMFLLHLEADQYTIVALDQPIVDEAIRLTFHQGLRAYDAAQLATAIEASKTRDRNRFVFLTADTTLQAVAEREGLQTDNPLYH
ncbi:MAG TPA: type II toxin-antitoxin system VapC family toxin [Blastocatellia bacterium]|nr:type II toxin-antitoxin system VapC family toxin [Blastocatellia bacterium]